MRSLERHLLVWVMGALVIGAIGLSLISYLATLHEMNEVFDENLKQVALSVASYHHAGHGKAEASSLGPRTGKEDGVDPADLVTLTWTPEGRLTFSSDPGVSIPFERQSGAARVRAADGTDWHVYTVVLEEGVVQSAQSVSTRREAAAESATKLFVPLVAFLVVIGALLVFALRRGLRPLDAAAEHVAERTAISLEPIGVDGMPREIHPLVQAIDAMMGRLSVAFDTQRRFVADAAHELRTPITALRLQSQLLEQAQDDVARIAALEELRAGIDRSEHLVTQLLRLSRLDPAVAAARKERVDLSGLARSVVAAWCVQAEHKGIDLGAGGRRGIELEADREQLLVMLNNLVGNAIRYTPRGGVVDVTTDEIDGHPAVLVTDNGPGIAEGERDRVFDRFYRSEGTQSDAEVAGSGLGLSIAQAVAHRHGATVNLRTAPSGHGLEVGVVFPRAATGHAVSAAGSPPTLPQA